MLLQGTDCLHESSLKIGADAHDLAGGLHLGAQGALGAYKLVKGQAGHLHHAVVQHGLKAGIGLLGNRIFNLIQGVAQSDFGRHLGDGIACGLGGQGGGTAHTGIYLDDAVFKAVRVQGVLYVAASRYAQLTDNIESGGTQHLVFLVPQSLGGSHHDAVAGVHAHRVDILHIADGNHIACPVPHYLILDFLPAGNAALHQHLSHTGETQAIFQNQGALLRVAGNAAAGTAQSVGRAKHHGISDFGGDFQALLHILHNVRGSDGLADFLHGLLEHLPVLGLLDGQGRGADEAHVVLL